MSKPTYPLTYKNQFGFSDHTLKTIHAALSSINGPNTLTEAKIFGSRAMGNYKSYSDVDICLFGDISNTCAYTIKDDLEEKTVYDYDILVYGKINNENLKSHINNIGIKIF